MTTPVRDTGGLNILDYRLVVFDLDGTLYRQGPVRRAMLVDLLRSGGTPGRLVRLRLLRRFRQLREDMALTAPQGFDAPLFAQLARETGQDAGPLRALVTEWIEERPLRHLAAARVPGAAGFFDALRRHGIIVAVWSDYPVAAKLVALGLRADHQICATDSTVNALKPHPAGLVQAMARAGVSPHQTLMVGDRLPHDGAAAAAAGVDFLLRSNRRPIRLETGQFHLRDFTDLVQA